MAAVHELGAVVGRFESDNARRRRIFAAGAPMAVVVAAVTGLVGFSLAGAGPSPLLLVTALVCGLALGTLGSVVWQGWLAHARPDEAITLHEGGFVYSYTGKSWAIAWGEIAKVYVERRDNVLYRAVGADNRYRVKLRAPVDGRRAVVITGITADAFRLGETMREAVNGSATPKPDTTQ